VNGRLGRGGALQRVESKRMVLSLQEYRGGVVKERG
jgi:hypothetical protein